MSPVQRIQQYGAHGTLGAIGMIVVIQSLRPGDLPTGRLLHGEIESAAKPYGNRLQVHYKTVRSADELEFLLNELEAYVTLTGRAPCLHIDCHGDANGIQLTDGSYMPWSRLKPLLANINLASKMNLLLVLACCFGGFFAAECRYLEPVPFAYIVGPGKKIFENQLYALTGGFYSELFRSWDVTKALTAGGGGREDISYFSMSAVGIFRIGLRARLKGMDRARLDVEQPLFDQYRLRFFALDRFPENADRFAITFAEVRAEAEAAAVSP